MMMANKGSLSRWDDVKNAKRRWKLEIKFTKKFLIQIYPSRWGRELSSRVSDVLDLNLFHTASKFEVNASHSTNLQSMTQMTLSQLSILFANLHEKSERCDEQFELLSPCCCCDELIKSSACRFVHSRWIINSPLSLYERRLLILRQRKMLEREKSHSSCVTRCRCEVSCTMENPSR